MLNIGDRVAPEKRLALPPSPIFIKADYERR
nr:MAG TPA: hypothetical protein [Caudoviricetes sp.]DAH41137.1 MAG TPA: hypothetical protein [Caudoviricetes sp.]DAK00793.1 MAG TPA: hypothetical protein [Caudoviricetes sp.]DAR37658.1 MAG TPA: hypothetical protein [Caudoviricetes sp.]